MGSLWPLRACRFNNRDGETRFWQSGSFAASSRYEIYFCCVASLANIWILPARRALSPCFWGALNVTEFTTGYTRCGLIKFEIPRHRIDLISFIRADRACRERRDASEFRTTAVPDQVTAQSQLTRLVVMFE